MEELNLDEQIMSELPSLVKDLALILVVAGIVTLVFKRLKQPLVLGYIVAGFLVSPHMPYLMSVVDKADIQTWADIGVIFLLFSLGLDFSVKKILRTGGCSRHCRLYHYFLYDGTGCHRRLQLRVERNGLYFPGRYACHEFYYHNL